MTEATLIALTARIEAHLPERRELVQALLTWATDARGQPGVLASRVYEDLETSAAFCLVAEWESREAMEQHIRGSGFGVVLGALEVLAAAPLVTITPVDDPDGSGAMQRIRRLRGSSRDQ